MRVLAHIFAVFLFFPTSLLGQAESDATTLFEAVEQGESDGLPPEALTEQLINDGWTAARVVYAIANAYASCDATYASVSMATFLKPDEAEAVVTSVSQLTGCGCSANTQWARVRLDDRIRTPALTQPVELPGVCGCLAAGVQAAVSAAPANADRIVRAAIDAGQQISSPIMDAIGQRGAVDEKRTDNGVMTNVPLAEANVVYRRKPEVCEADNSDLDEFDPSQDWIRADGFGDIGAHQAACGSGDGELNELIVSEFMTSDSGGSYVEFYNGSSDPVDLRDQDIKLSVFYQGVDTRSQTVDLMGTVFPGDTFVVAGENAPESALARADFIVPYLSYAMGDTMTLHAGYTEESCGCTEAIAASAIRAAPPDFLLNRQAQQVAADLAAAEEAAEADAGAEPAEDAATVPGEVTPAMSRAAEMIKAKILRFYGQADDLRPGFVVDHVGEVPLMPEQETAEPLMSQINRGTTACSGEGNELDAFNLADESWETPQSPGLNSIGSHWANCRTATSDIILSEVVNVEGDVGAVEIYNPTPATIDLEDGGYVLEIYPPDGRSPVQVVPMTGIMAPRAAFVIAAEEAASQIPQPPDLLLSDLNLDQRSAVVLRRLVSPSALRCSASLALALATLDTDANFFVTDPISPRDPTVPPIRVDPLASPN